jgi:NADH dehydrogenase [ubiquinone] 1 alpha subcomplex assembly factor 7
MTCDPHLRRDTPLGRALKDRIRREGPLGVRAYMEACLYDPQHGVYRSKPAIGHAGDFVTAPEISQIFGELIGLWCAVVWQQMGSPAAIDLIEIGPGRGTLMSDALRATRRVPGFHAALRVTLVDSSETLTAIQRATLADAPLPLHWQASLDGLTRDAAIPALVIANEVLDCQPRDQFVRRGDSWILRRIGLDAAGDLTFDDTAAPAAKPDLDALHGAATTGDIAEAGAYEVLRQVLALRPVFAALMIDYGHTRSGLGDTLQAVRQHQHEHPLASPGEADITMQVDFAAVARHAASIAGVHVDGPSPQAEFLGGLGVLERASRLMAANPLQAASLEADVARLLSPGGMGTRFQAISFRSADVPPLPGFPA